MRFTSRTPARTDSRTSVTGTARVDRRLPALLRRLRPGDVAVIDLVDLDRASAEALIEREVAAVVNAAPALSGRFPALGPETLVTAGVPLIDDVGAEAFSALKDGAKLELLDGRINSGGREVASGRSVTPELLGTWMDDARGGMTAQLQTFTSNAVEFLRREQGLMLHGEGVPELRTVVSGRSVVVVVAGYDYRTELKRIKRYLREQRPVLVGVDGGIDALVAAGYTPDLGVVGQASLGQATEAARTRGATEAGIKACREVLLHADESGRLVGVERIEKMGVRPQTISAGGGTADVALLVLDQRGAHLITTVGMHASLDEFLDRQRAGDAGAFLTRLRVGHKLVDARAVPVLYTGRVRPWQLWLLLLVGLLAVAVAIATTPVGQDWWETLR
ncbi:MAG: putative cytokinetic ring protein SteA [Nocardioidaceae bacterium]